MPTFSDQDRPSSLKRNHFILKEIDTIGKTINFPKETMVLKKIIPSKPFSEKNVSKYPKEDSKPLKILDRLFPPFFKVLFYVLLSYIIHILRKKDKLCSEFS